MTAPLATVLIPAKDEERWIRDCLESVAAQDHPHHMLEVIVVVDATSTDRTDVIAKEFLEGQDFAAQRGGPEPRWRDARQPERGIVRRPRRGAVPRRRAQPHPPSLRPDLRRRAGRAPEVVVVGGAQLAVPSRDGSVGVGIARALNNRFAMGWSRYRRGAASGAADTVYLGAFRTEQLRRAGGWSSRFPTNQDFELNRRLGADGLVWFDASLPVEYIPRTSVAGLYQQYVRFGRWKVRYWRRAGDRPRPRQVALLVVVPVGAVAAAGALTRVRRPGLLVGALIAGAAVLEARGTRGPSGGPRARAVSVGAIAAVAGGWLSGAWRELVRPSHDD